VLTWIAAAALLAWLFLMFARGGFWRTRAAAVPSAPEPGVWPRVVVVVPARNEATGIGGSLRSLRAQDYPGILTVIVVDDRSSDGTAGAARDAAGGMARFTLISGRPRQPGWTGKLWALQQGLLHAEVHEPAAEWLWLTDANIVHAPDVLRRLIAKGESSGLALVSLMVRLSCEGRVARLLIPPFVFFFQKLFPFAWVNDPQHRLAAAAGGCLLVRCDALRRAGGLSAIRSHLIDDCALAAAVKPHGPIWLGLALTSYSLRQYPRLGDVWAMVVRTAYSALGFSPLRLGLCVVGMLLSYQAPWIVTAEAVYSGAPLAGALGVAAMLLMLRCYVPTVSSFGLPAVWGLTLPLAALAYTLMTVDSARRHWLGHGGAWKGRFFPPHRAEVHSPASRRRRSLEAEGDAD
jgi:hopene-associated glycosyltransferase HpnB